MSTTLVTAYPPSVRSDVPFLLCFAVLGGLYLVLIVALLVAQVSFTVPDTPDHLLAALSSPAIRSAIKLSLLSTALTAILSLWVAVPLGYLLARFSFPGKS